MKKNKISAVMCIVIILIFGIASNVYALQPNNSENKNYSKSEKCKKNHNDKYHKLSKTLLLQSLGLKENEVKAARKSGKSIVDLAKEKGKTLEEIKAAMIDAKIKAIDQAVKDGKLTKEEGEKKAARIREKITNWDGSVKHKHKH